MPQPEEAGLHSVAILWAAIPGSFDANGEQRLLPPVPVYCAWDMKRTQSINTNGTPLALDGTVRFQDRVPIGSKVWFAETPYPEEALTEWYGIGSAGDLTEILVLMTENIKWDPTRKFKEISYGFQKTQDSPREPGE